VNFVNVLYLSTDLHLTYDSTTTLKNALSLKLLFFHCSDIYLSSTVVSVEIGNQYYHLPMFVLPPLDICLSNFSHPLTFVLLNNFSSNVDLMPLGNIEKVQLEFSNDFVIIKSCRNITDLSALKPFLV
jgi:hypothetical protein